MKAMKTACLALAALALAACDKGEIALSRGEQLDPARQTSLSALVLRSARVAGERVEIVMTEGDGFRTEELYVRTAKPLPLTETLLLQADTARVQAYSEATGIAYTLLPERFYAFLGGGAFDLAEGQLRSVPRQLRLNLQSPMGDSLPAGRYLLPVTLVSPWQGDAGSVVYFDLTVRQKWPSKAPLHDGREMFMVFYVNTSQFDPRLATDFYMEKYSRKTGKFALEWYEGVGNIVNLRKSSIGYDAAAGRATLELTADLRYVLESSGTYVLPVQETGRKVCLCIEGGGRGIGFCNLTDAQIADFTAQVVALVTEHRLDGVNLWDRNANYGKDPALPPPGTTAYPKLIKALREALGPDKLLTLVDYEEPTEAFWDVEACGGIAVGEYLDYAWSGYNSPDEPIQVIDPYHPGRPGVSALHPRRPIAGLNPKRYGCTNAYWHPGMPVEPYLQVIEWEKSGLRKNNIFAFEDIRSLLQDKYEGGTWEPSPFIQQILSPDYSVNYRIDSRALLNMESINNRYGKWLKEW